MTPTTDHITDEDIDREGRQRGFLMTFSPKMEGIFRRHNRDENYRYVFFSGLIGTLLYDLFLISDWFVSHTDFYLYVIVRLGVATPLSLIASYQIIKRRNYYQFWLSLSITTMSLCLAFLLIVTHGSYRSTYLFGDILMMMCYSVIARPLIKHAAVTIAVQFISYTTVVVFSNILTPESIVVSLLFCVSGAVLALIACYATEQASRRQFLMSVRIQLLNETLAAMATTDHLTSLGNRRSLEQVTQQFWATKDPSRRASVILIDIDRFKSYNDNYGHAAGDLALQVISRCVTDATRESRHSAVRFGGEELLVFMPDADQIEARGLAESIRLAICDRALAHSALAADAIVTASLGVAHALVSDCNAAELIARADIALYAAKRNGRNQVWPPPSASSSGSGDGVRSLAGLSSAA